MGEDLQEANQHLREMLNKAETERQTARIGLEQILRMPEMRLNESAGMPDWSASEVYDLLRDIQACATEALEGSKGDAI